MATKLCSYPQALVTLEIKKYRYLTDCLTCLLSSIPVKHTNK